MSTAAVVPVAGEVAPTRPDWSPIAKPAAHGALAHTLDVTKYQTEGPRVVVPRSDLLGGSLGCESAAPVPIHIDPTDPITGSGGLTVDLRKLSVADHARAKTALERTGDSLAAFAALAAGAATAAPAVAATAAPAVAPTAAPAVAPAAAPVAAPAVNFEPVRLALPGVPVARPRPSEPETIPPMTQPSSPAASSPNPPAAAADPALTGVLGQLAAALYEIQTSNCRILQTLAEEKAASPATPEPLAVSAPAEPSTDAFDHPQPVQDAHDAAERYKSQPGYVSPLQMFAGPPERPRTPVIFHLADGLYQQHFHHVAIRGTSILLFYDGRYKGDSRFVPSSSDKKAIAITLPSQGDARYQVYVLPLANNLDYVDIIQLLIARDDQPEEDEA